jgi:hypothetical protein
MRPAGPLAFDGTPNASRAFGGGAVGGIGLGMAFAGKALTGDDGGGAGGGTGKRRYQSEARLAGGTLGLGSGVLLPVLLTSIRGGGGFGGD